MDTHDENKEQEKLTGGTQKLILDESETAETDGLHRSQFRIEVADGDQGKFFDIKPLGNHRYEIFVEGDTIGTIQLDERDHAHCESVACELDMPLLHSIRTQIQFHEQWRAKD